MTSAEYSAEPAQSSQQAVQYSHAIEGYSNQQSVVIGQTIQFFVSSTTSDYEVTILRHGLLGGSAVSGPTTYNNGSARTVPTNAAINGAQWEQFGASFVVPVPSGSSAWKSGLYTAKLRQPSTGKIFYVPFIVRDAPGTEKNIALLASTNTWAAYNFWPYSSDPNVSLSIYDGCQGYGNPHTDTISLLRPNPNGSPEVLDYACQDPVAYPYFLSRTEHLLAGEIRIAEWLERQTNPARPYSMLTDVDLHNEGAAALTAFSTVIISTHSEYWSTAMRTAVDSYLRAGGNVISLSGNTMYHIVSFDGAGHMTKGQDWLPTDQARILGVANTGNTPVVCNDYKVKTPAHWAFPAGLVSGSSVGSNGVIGQVLAPPHTGGDYSRTFCTNGGSGAAGWEYDYKYPIFARTYNHLAYSSTGSDIVYMRRASAGQIFSVGSITFGQSLLQEQLTGGYLPGMITNVLNRFSSRSFSDFGGDGKADLIARNASGQLIRYDGNGAGGLVQNGGQVISTVFGQYNAIISPGDFDGDGKPDLLARDTGGTLWLFRGNGTGGFLSGNPTAADSGWNVLNTILGVGDWDGDGRNDLVARNSGGTLLLYRGNGAGGFFPGSQSLAPWFMYNRTIPIGDFDGDGNPDLLAVNSAGTMFRCSGNGTGGFINPSTPCVSIDSGWNIFNAIVGVGDFAGDGFASVIARDTSGNLRLYQGTGSGTFRPGFASIDSGWSGLDIVSVW